jgi:ribosome-interacting GTPase 1
MPANLTKQYLKAEARYKNAIDPEEKLECLQEMMREIPKHKGTEKMRGDIKKRISQLTKTMQSSKGKKAFSYRIEKQGGGCIVLLGPPNSGKSSLLNALTNASAETAEYPFTTREPYQAMMMHEDVPIQLVDLPPLSKQYIENWLLPLARTGDMIFMVFDLSRAEILEDMEMVFRQLEKGKIRAVEKIVEDDDEEDYNFEYLPTIVLLNKTDHPNAKEHREVFIELFDKKLPVYPVSIIKEQGVEDLRRLAFEKLEILRVYSKSPGQKADIKQPFILKKGSTLLDFARKVHKDFADNLKFARIWGESVLDGQRVDRAYILQDKDIIELHI